MRSRSIALTLGLSVLAFSLSGQAQGHRRLNPMIALHEKGLPVFGITHPAIAIGGRGRPAAPGATDKSTKGIANVREIAAVPGLTVMVVGAGTLGGVFSSTGADGQRVRDQAGFDAGVASILAACKEFKVACSYPANNPAEIETLMAQGFSVFTMQARNSAAFDAVATGRRLSGRPLPTGQ